MGGGNWSRDAYDDRTKVRASTGTSAFAYDDDVKKGKTARAVHPLSAPTVTAGNASLFAGKVMRESRDSDEHPESLAIAILFDETGSMGSIPVELQKKLAGMMTLLLQKGYVAHPQILFGAIGDAYSDEAPLQIGQFESSNTMEDDLSKIWIEGNGGGTKHESYELALYFIARHTSIDCFEKRGAKGYLFTIGDEMPYEKVNRHQVKKHIEDDLEADISVAEIVKELEQKYHVFHLLVPRGSNFVAGQTDRMWKDLLGERALTLDDPSNAAEMIALTIGLNEGTIDVDAGIDHLKDAGLAVHAANELSTALAPLARNAAMAKAGTVSGLPDVPAGGGVTTA